MEKMNQVSVSEFMSKSKEEMYDMAVEMVEKYNRLVDICNDSAERIADLVIERDNLSKGVQKLIGERDELIERHKVYTNALNKDIADKAAKIDLLEKEIEGRKEGYVALKERMDTKYISIDEHNAICKTYEDKVAKLEKESEKWQDLAKMNRDTICDQYNVCEEFKNKITEIEEEVEKWKKKFDDSRKETINRNAKIVILEEENEKLKVDLIHEREKNEKLAKDHAELENDVRKYAAAQEEVKRLKEENKDLKIRDEELTKQVANKLSDIDSLRKYITHWKNQERIRTDQLRATERKVEELWEEIDNLKNEKANMEDEYGRKGFKRYIKWLVKEEEAKYKESWKARLNEELEAIFKEEEETEVNDIPCGEDAIE